MLLGQDSLSKHDAEQLAAQLEDVGFERAAAQRELEQKRAEAAAAEAEARSSRRECEAALVELTRMTETEQGRVAQLARLQGQLRRQSSAPTTLPSTPASVLASASGEGATVGDVMLPPPSPFGGGLQQGQQTAMRLQKELWTERQQKQKFAALADELQTRLAATE